MFLACLSFTEIKKSIVKLLQTQDDDDDDDLNQVQFDGQSIF